MPSNFTLRICKAYFFWTKINDNGQNSKPIQNVPNLSEWMKWMDFFHLGFGIQLQLGILSQDPLKNLPGQETSRPCFCIRLRQWKMVWSSLFLRPHRGAWFGMEVWFWNHPNKNPYLNHTWESFVAGFTTPDSLQVEHLLCQRSHVFSSASSHDIASWLSNSTMHPSWAYVLRHEKAYRNHPCKTQIENPFLLPSINEEPSFLISF